MIRNPFHRILVLMTILLPVVIITSCKKAHPDIQEPPAVSDLKSIEQYSPNCTGALIAGQNTPIGWMTTDLSGDMLTVTYEIDVPGWYLKETHLDVQHIFTNFPLTRKFAPQIGHFQFSASFNPNEGRTKWIQVIDLTQLDPDDYGESSHLCIAAHAVVGGIGNETVWAEGNPFYKGWGMWLLCNKSIIGH